MPILAFYKVAFNLLVCLFWILLQNILSARRRVAIPPFLKWKKPENVRISDLIPAAELEGGRRDNQQLQQRPWPPLPRFFKTFYYFVTYAWFSMEMFLATIFEMSVTDWWWILLHFDFSFDYRDKVTCFDAAEPRPGSWQSVPRNPESAIDSRKINGK